MGHILSKYPRIMNWLIGKNVCSYENLEDFFDQFQVAPDSKVREGAREFVEEFCKKAKKRRKAKKPFRYYFKSKDSFGKMIGIDRLGRRFAVGRSGYRISTKWYKRFFPK